MNYPVKIFPFILLTLLLISGCNKEYPVQVGFMIHALDKERWENDMNFFVEKVNELGGTVHVRIADNDMDKQLSQADELINMGVDVMLIVPVDQFAAAQIVEKANKNNIRVISYDRLIKNCRLDYYISTDNVEIGRLQAEYLTTIKPSGNYALIGGAVTDNNSQFLYLGQMNVLQPLVEKGDINIV